MLEHVCPLGSLLRPHRPESIWVFNNKNAERAQNKLKMYRNQSASQDLRGGEDEEGVEEEEGEGGQICRF